MLWQTCIRLGLWLALLDICLAGGTYISSRLFGLLICGAMAVLMLRTRRKLTALRYQ